MFGYILLLFIITPLIELALLIKIGEMIGVMPTVGIVILTGLAGAILAKAQGFVTLRRIQDDLSRGIMPGEQIINGILILCGGLLLMTPGLITDAVGFAALIPFTRALLKRFLRKKLARMVKDGNVITFRY